MTDALVDVKNGNGNRRILSATNELTAPIAYEINEIVVAYESRLSTVRQTEETNRQLMTSLSHDVRTPLTTLIGYLDAAHKGLVTGCLLYTSSVWADASECSKGFFGRILRVSWLAVSVL